LVERLHGMQEVRSSILLSSTRWLHMYRAERYGRSRPLAEGGGIAAFRGLRRSLRSLRPYLGEGAGVRSAADLRVVDGVQPGHEGAALSACSSSRVRATASSTCTLALIGRPCSSRMYHVTPTPRSWAPSSTGSGRRSAGRLSSYRPDSCLRRRRSLRDATDGGFLALRRPYGRRRGPGVGLQPPAHAEFATVREDDAADAGGVLVSLLRRLRHLR
jgi:hypothetical protein